MDFDYSWKEPTGPQLAAWEKACDAMGVSEKDREWAREHHHTMVMMEANRRAYAVDAEIYDGSAHEMTPYTLAEMILLADGSLWYTQAKAWAEGKFPPYIKDSGTQAVFQTGASFIKRIVDHGYQNGKWWDLTAIWPDCQRRCTALVIILDTCRMARLGSSRSLHVSSAAFAYLPQLLFPKQVDVGKAEKLLAGGEIENIRHLNNELLAAYDPEFRKKWLRAQRQVRAEIHEEYEPTACIHPECDNLVAPKGIKPREGHYKNYRGTGACQQGHNSYYCIKCKKPHSFVSKIGQSHYPEHYHHDWDGLDESGEKWVPRG